MCYIDGGSDWWILFGWLLFEIILGSAITLVILLVRRITSRGGSERSHLALDIASQRYNRGEISREEFEQINKDLS